MVYCGMMVVAPVVFLSHHFHIMYASNQNLEAGKALVLSPDFIYHFQWNTWGTESVRVSFPLSYKFAGVMSARLGSGSQ